MAVAAARHNSPLWTPEERKAWRPSPFLRPSEWAEKYRVLSEGQSARPGPWRNANAPHLRFLMDVCVAPGVQQVNIIKGAQVGFSEAMRNIIGYFAHTQPDPMGLTLPNRQLGEEIVDKRIIPLFEDTECLRDLQTGKKKHIKRTSISLINGYNLHLMWAGSAASTSANPMRVVINDEVDKFESWSSGEPDPIGRTFSRTKSYGDRRLQINGSTPTDITGVINAVHSASQFHLTFNCPCPHCGHYQHPIFSQIKWSKVEGESSKETAERVLRDNCVWYECISCGKRILPDQKYEFIQHGKYQSTDGEIIDAEKVETWPRGTTIGIHINALTSLWESWASIVAQFLRAKGDYEKTYNFKTETLGETWEEQTERVSRSIYALKSREAEYEEGIAPPWTLALLATVDTQHDHFYLVIRAWGAGMRSQRVFHGKLYSFAEIDDFCFKRQWRVAGDVKPAMKVRMVLIDSGGTRLAGESISRTMEVYRYSMQRRNFGVRPIKGASKKSDRGLFIWQGKGLLDDGHRTKSKQQLPSVTIWFVDTQHFSNLWSDYVQRGTDKRLDEREVWFLNQNNDDEYNAQLGNLHKVIVRNRRGAMEERWVPIEAGARVDYADCEVYQIAAAYMARIDMYAVEDEVKQYEELATVERRQEAQRQQPERPKGPGVRRSSSGWDISSFDMGKHL